MRTEANVLCKDLFMTVLSCRFIRGQSSRTCHHVLAVAALSMV
jgi:hypothetical protein